MFRFVAFIFVAVVFLSIACSSNADSDNNEEIVGSSYFNLLPAEFNDTDFRGEMLQYVRGVNIRIEWRVTAQRFEKDREEFGFYRNRDEPRCG